MCVAVRVLGTITIKQIQSLMFIVHVQLEENSFQPNRCFAYCLISSCRLASFRFVENKIQKSMEMRADWVQTIADWMIYTMKNSNRLRHIALVLSRSKTKQKMKKDRLLWIVNTLDAILDIRVWQLDGTSECKLCECNMGVITCSRKPISTANTSEAYFDGRHIDWTIVCFYQ